MASLVNLNENIRVGSNESLVYYLFPGKNVLGCSSEAVTNQSASIIIKEAQCDNIHQHYIMGFDIQQGHATILNENGCLTISSLNPSADITINGLVISEPTVLKHRDRIQLAKSCYFRVFGIVFFIF